MTDTYTTPYSLSGLLTATSVPVKLDTYNGCTHGCTYCYSAASKARFRTNGITESSRFEDLKPANLNYVKYFFEKLVSGVVTKDPAVLWLREHPVFQWGVLTDPLPGPEKKFKTTLSILEILLDKKVKFTFTTKGTTLLTSDAYLGALLPFKDRCVILISCSAIDDRIAAIEPLAPHPRDRVEACRILSSLGFTVLFRLEPFYPHMLKESMQAIEAYAEAGAKGVVVGAIYLKGKPEKNTLAMYTELDRGLKHQITKELKKENYKQDGDYFWSYDHTLKWHQILRKVAHASGIKYFPADSPSRLIGDAASPFGTSLIGLKGPSNNCALTELAYESPNDFGLHQIDLTKPNLQSDGLRLWHSSSAKRADLASKGIKTVADVIRYWYNDPKWVRGLIPYSKPFGVDSNGDIHYRVDSKYLDFCREGRSV